MNLSEAPLSGFTDDIHLVLHGYFFVDAGRSRIEGLDATPTGRAINDARSLRERWNALLFQQGTLPLVLPALADFVRQASLTDNEITELTHSFTQLDLYRNQTFRGALCREHQWIYCVGHKDRRWRLLPASTAVLAIPETPAAEPDRPFSVLPKLASIPFLAFEDFPRLSSHDALTAWDVATLASTLDIDVATIFASTTKLDYLIRFLEICPKSITCDHTIARHASASIERRRTAALAHAIIG